MRVSKNRINPVLENRLKTSLSQVLADLRDETEAKAFLQDFLNESEFQTLAKRLAIAYWLTKGRSYTNIKENLKVSSATIATIQNILERPGVKIALKKLAADEWANKWSEMIKNLIK